MRSTLKSSTTQYTEAHEESPVAEIFHWGIPVAAKVVYKMVLNA
jgi:hypothetical protein